MNVFKISKVAEAVISDIAGYEVRIDSDIMALNVEPRDEAGNLVLVIRIPIEKVFPPRLQS